MSTGGCEMSRDKENIVGLAWNKVLVPLAKGADPISWIIFAGFIVLLVVSIVLRLTTGEWNATYMGNYPYFWYGAWALLVIATVGPIFNLARIRNEVPLDVLVGVSVVHVVVFIVISVVTLSEKGNISAVTALLAATAAAAMVGIGWAVQHQSSARASRRAHTFNILMQSRLSKEFQDQVKRKADVYFAGNRVEPADAELVNRSGLKRRISLLETERDLQLSRARDEAHSEIKAQFEEDVKVVKAKYESLQGLKYLLNFYEFMCAGIVLRELDEPMLKETLSDIAVSLYADSVHVRQFVRESQPQVFVNLDRVVGALWSNGKPCH